MSQVVPKFISGTGSTTGQVLTSNGPTSAPSWQNNTPAFSGLTTNGVIYATSSTSVSSTGTGTSGQILVSNGSGSAPTFQSVSGITVNAWSGYFDSGYSWNQSTNSQTDFTISTTGTFNQRQNSNFGTVMADTDGTPGITFTPPSLGLYYVSFNVPIYNNTTSGITNLFLVDGSGNTISTAYFQEAVANIGIQSTILAGLYNVTSLSSTTIKIQASSYGAGSVGSSITSVASQMASSLEITIFQL
jgi:hypothetical protein